MPQPRKRTTSGIQRRSRTIAACQWCRAKKYKCDGNLPCMRCRRRQVNCVFEVHENANGNTTEYSISSVQELKKRLESAEACIRRSIPSAGQENGVLPLLHLETPVNAIRHSGRIANSVPSQDGSMRPSSHNSFSLERTSLSLSKPGQATDEPGDMNGDELMDINSVTQNFEFHGSTSVVALFNRLRKVRQSSTSSSEQEKEPDRHEYQERSVVSDFHNEAFPGYYGNIDGPADFVNEENYSLHAMLFIDAYFKSLHFVHPVLEQGWFLKRCNDLWTGRTQNLRRSFMALYFSVLCLGACIRTWTEESINGMARLDWICLLFRKAERALGRSGSVNDLEAVQAPFILCQLCLHQMNLNLAYAFLGMAMRTAFSTGINRKVTFADQHYPQDSPFLSVSRTWWALYNLEIELSFTLGRPNALGLDRYHNRPLPPIDHSENAIIPVTRQLSYIVRRVSTEIYLSRARPNEKLQQAIELESELEQWLSSLPSDIQPSSEPAECQLSNNSIYRMGTIRGPYWPQLQKLVLRIRFLHVKIILFYLFFINEEKISLKESLHQEQLHAAVEKCWTAARSMIRILYWTYRMYHSFHTWGYNTTYVVLVLSVFLSKLAQEPLHTKQNSECIEYIYQSLEIMDAMEGCRVALKISHFAKRLLASLLCDGNSSTTTQNDQALPGSTAGVLFSDGAAFFPRLPEESQTEYGTFNFFEEGLLDFALQ